MLLDLESTTWSDEACSAFELDPGSLPKVVDCDDPGRGNGCLRRDAPGHRARGRPAGRALRRVCFAPGEAKCTYGTGAFILATVGEDVARSQARLAACVAWRLGGTTTYCLDGQVYSAGSAVSWLQELDLISEPADLDQARGEDDDVVFVPSLAGLGAPFWAPEARGGWLGLSLASRREGTSCAP